MNEFEKEYQLWLRGNEEYNPTEYDTLEECIKADKNYTEDWYITKKVKLDIKEKAEVKQDE